MTTMKALYIAALTSLVALPLTGCDQAPTSLDPKVASQASTTEPSPPSNGIVLSVLGVANATVVSASVAGRYVGVSIAGYPVKRVPVQELPTNASNVNFYKPHVSGVEDRYVRCPRAEATVATYQPEGSLEAIKGKMGSVESVGVVKYEYQEGNYSDSVTLLFPENTATAPVEYGAEGFLLSGTNQYDPVTQTDYYTFPATRTRTFDQYDSPPSTMFAVDLAVRVKGSDGKPISGLKAGNFWVTGDNWQSVTTATETEAGLYLVRGHMASQGESPTHALRVSVRNAISPVIVPVSR
ncbi:MAG TPA: hypothetical protein V6D00_08415 [Pantanalinema sp.]